jgi:hypothetical protein
MLGATETSRGISDLFEADPDRRGLHRSSNAGARALRGEVVTPGHSPICTSAHAA